MTPARLAFAASALLLQLASPACGQVGSALIEVDPLPAVEVRPDRPGRRAVGDTVHFAATVHDARGSILSVPVVWRSSDESVVRVDPRTGVAEVLGPGAASIWAEVALSGEAPVRRTAPPSVPPTDVSGGRAAVAGAAEVVYPSEEVAFIAGPQLKLGSSQNPWPWYDETMLGRGPVHAQKVMDAAAIDSHIAGYVQYYDLGLSLYLLYYRTGETQYLEQARNVVDRWYDEYLLRKGNNVAPRMVALGGVLLRAMDGRPEMFDYAVKWARFQDRNWLNRHYARTEPYAGIRDGGFTLLYLAQIAAVHPDPEIRSEFRTQALLAGQWYARIQKPDGAWYYNAGKFDGEGRVTQPFQIGFLLEGLIATHQLTGDAGIGQAILNATDFLWKDGFDPSYPWEALFYSVAEDPAQRKEHPGPAEKENATWGYRHLNSTVVHAFGYAYKISGETKYRDQGDRLFEAAFNYDPADPRRSTGLAADANGKEYNQSYRSSGRYLVWRLGGR